MKERVQLTRKKNNGGRGSGWKPEYSSEGSMRFGVKGYVQKIKQGKTKNGDCDFVTFLIDNPFVKGNINSINIECSYDLPQLEDGDHVIVRGNIRSWWDDDAEMVTYSFVADEILEVEAGDY